VRWELRPEKDQRMNNLLKDYNSPEEEAMTLRNGISDLNDFIVKTKDYYTKLILEDSDLAHYYAGVVVGLDLVKDKL
jgi:hypothetical protein